MADDSSDDEVKNKVSVTFQSERIVENKKDDLATSTVQIDTEIEKDARTIFENSLKGESVIFLMFVINYFILFFK